jgi:hypothetical protein
VHDNRHSVRLEAIAEELKKLSVLKDRSAHQHRRPDLETIGSVEENQLSDVLTIRADEEMKLRSVETETTAEDLGQSPETILDAEHANDRCLQPMIRDSVPMKQSFEEIQNPDVPMIHSIETINPSSDGMILSFDEHMPMCVRTSTPAVRPKQ